MTEPVTVVSYGAGTNSTAMLTGMVARREPAPYAILLADTGGERPKAYEYVEMFSGWLTRQGYPPITIVKKVDLHGDVLTLEQNCLNKHMLPSIAYGYKTCSQKYKIQPQDKWCNNDPVLSAEWKAGRKVTKLIGYDADEPQRAKDYTSDKYNFRYPLLEWGWGREECVNAIAECQLPQPGKSSCFFCPNMGADEVRDLAKHNPDLMARALAMESNADLTTIKGLGRGQFSWRDLMRQGDLFDGWWAPRDQPCGCYD